jgi:hypothetical protein
MSSILVIFRILPPLVLEISGTRVLERKVIALDLK